MEPEYYTPHISEIHFGFDFQYFSPTVKEWIDYKWNTPFSEITIKGTGLVISGFKIDKENIRVKYIDRADVEDLGWKVIKEPCRWQFAFVDGRYRLFSNIYSSTDLFPYKGTLHIVDDRDGDAYGVFNGRVKNKFELKKIMQQNEIIT